MQCEESELCQGEDGEDSAVEETKCTEEVWFTVVFCCSLSVHLAC